MRCDVIATGVINAAKSIGMKKPIVIRLQGTNVEQANDLIANWWAQPLLLLSLSTSLRMGICMPNLFFVLAFECGRTCFVSPESCHTEAAQACLVSDVSVRAKTRLIL